MGCDPATVVAFVLSERGKHISETGLPQPPCGDVQGSWHPMRHAGAFAGRTKRSSSTASKPTTTKGSMIEISANRLRHSMQTAVTHCADLRTARGQQAAQDARETPIVNVRDRGIQVSAKRRTRTDRKPRSPRTRPNGEMADPEGFESSLETKTRKRSTPPHGCRRRLGPLSP